MLKGIPGILSPELLKVMAEMGHGDELVIADRNFPAASVAKRLIRADGHGAVPLLEAILKVYPLDGYVSQPVMLMQVVAGDTATTPIWEEYRRVLKASGEKFGDFGYMERFEFYERARKAYAVIATSESLRYANIILKKGVILS